MAGSRSSLNNSFQSIEYKDEFGIDYLQLMRRRLRGELPGSYPPPSCGAALRVAAVLIPVVTRTPTPTVLLTRRTDHLLDHAGQVSFPGGSREPDDADPVATALRETEEELGLPPSRVEPLGMLTPYHTVTGFLINPVVGLVEPGPLEPNPHEVAAAFEVPIDYLLESSRFEKRERQWQGRRHEYYMLHYRQEVIWGATAYILRDFCQLLGATP